MFDAGKFRKQSENVRRLSNVLSVLHSYPSDDGYLFHGQLPEWMAMMFNMLSKVDCTALHLDELTAIYPDPTSLPRISRKSYTSMHAAVVDVSLLVYSWIGDQLGEQGDMEELDWIMPFLWDLPKFKLANSCNIDLQRVLLAECFDEIEFDHSLVVSRLHWEQARVLEQSAAMVDPPQYSTVKQSTAEPPAAIEAKAYGPLYRMNGDINGELLTAKVIKYEYGISNSKLSRLALGWIRNPGNPREYLYKFSELQPHVDSRKISEPR